MWQRGFTLIELMVTLMVIAVVVVMGAPSMADFINEMRMTSATNDVLSFFNYARSEAAKRNVRVTVCLSADLSTCHITGVDWAQGALAFTDTNSNNQVDAGETIVRVLNPSSGVTIFGKVGATFTAPDYRFYYRPSGAASSAGTLEVCRSGRKKREISINAVGRPMSALTTTTCS